tara:strand:+ start:265 stop:420 length:156 start_codon:yes stop_codon:yes gene_type:complete
MTKQFLQETNFQDESEAFKNDALDNFDKAYPTVDTNKNKRKKAEHERWENG